MADYLKTDKGFLVIKMSQEEAEALNFGISEGCLCMHCNNIIKEPIYYVAVLNDTMCEECYNKWYETATYYPEDSYIENKNFNYYRNALGFYFV